MTPKEYRLLDNHNYSFYTGKMGGVFNDWHDKKIDGTKAVQLLKKWHDKGLNEIEKEIKQKNENEQEKYADIKKKELKKHFDDLTSFIKKIELVDDELSTNYDDYENHILMKLLNDIAPTAYKTVKKAIAQNLIVYEDGLFNFKCARGCVGLIFYTAGFTEYKTIIRYILINGKPPAESTLRNGVKNASPKEWLNIKKQLFS